MPFKSKAQVRYMFAKDPQLAKEFARKTKSIARLPERRKDGKYNRRKPVMPKVS